MPKQIILPTDPDIIEQCNPTLWKVKNPLTQPAFYWKTEEDARLATATHKKCEKCDNLVEAPSCWTVCENCREKSAIERYSNLPKVKWSESGPYVYSDALVRYFDEDALVDFLEEVNEERDEESEIYTVDQLRLHPTYPKYLQTFEFNLDDADDYDDYNDLIPDDILNLFDQLNKLIEDSKVILRYYPDYKRALDTSDFDEPKT